MHPEDIDQLFREKLADHAPTPPAFLWAEIEAEIQPRKRRPMMWLAAASVALLALLGGLWWTLQNGAGLQNGRPELAATAPRRPAAATPENISQPQATPSPASPSSPSEAPANQPTAAVATAAPAAKTSSVGVQPDPVLAASRPSRPRASAQRQNVAQVATTAPAPTRPLGTTPEPSAAERELPQELSRPTELPAHTVALTGPIEVEVRPAATAAAPVAPAHRPRLVALLRQARNVVQGEKVSLTAAGLPETVTVQARLAGHTLTKVIQL
ncbi:hypothetical protein ACFPAF_06525 [Hymenobacter endophyticus]|uniref:Uncharacterized protein n=1 Tax=Hymenobacter endophyticus TaxID=3076335 RepID=A0ABU3TFC1_9BACT|nr:hypothetical protein [Hymenobacter endophyticus]MDU0370040.1 hypothetical protein [Hymenobacter endophyticus]